MTLFKRLGGLIVIVAVLAVGATYYYANTAEAKGPVNTLGSNEGVAIRGYDPVAYFTEGAPRKGKSEHSVEREGVTWLFASAENKTLFDANPEKYTPVYGGYCAYGVAQGYLVKIEPDAWAVRDGKLYLNYDKSVQKTWSEKPDAFIEEANHKWPDLIAKK